MPRGAVRLVLTVFLALTTACSTAAAPGPQRSAPAISSPTSASPGEPRQAAAVAQCFGSDFRGEPQDPVRAAAVLAGRVTLPPHGETSLPRDLSWTEDPHHDPNWRFQLHVLRWADVLRREGVRTGNRAMLDRHREILRDWLRDNPPGGARVPVAWGDMATGLRTIALACAVGSYGPRRWLLDALAAHGAVLDDPSFGSRSGNHALHVRNGLLVAGCVLGREDWISAAHSRIGALLRGSVDTEGVTDEGSVMYQQVNYRWYRETQHRLEACGQRPGAVFERVARMPAFVAHATDPSGRFVQIGDTDRVEVRPNQADGVAVYAATRGREGTRPTETYRVYGRGYVFGRSGWGESRPFTDELQYTLRFGPPLDEQVHGHEDAGALTLHAYGRPLLFDSGRYRYDGSPMRHYLDSRRAHNTVDVDGVRYRTDVPAQLVTARHTPEYDLTTIRVTALAGAVWTRTVFYSRAGRYLLVDDRVTGSTGREVVQRWNLPEDTGIHTNADSLDTEGPGPGISMLWVGSAPRLSVTRGRQNPLLGWRAYRYGEIFPTPVAEARVTGGRFTTLLAPRSGPEGPMVTDTVVSGNLVRMTVVFNGVTEKIRVTTTSARVERD
jgi:hypothetical protein